MTLGRIDQTVYRRKLPKRSRRRSSVRARTTLSGFSLMLLADAARVFGLREGV